MVLAIVAVATAGVQWGWSSPSRQLQRDAEHLAQWLDVVRADARAQGQVAHVRWNDQRLQAHMDGLGPRTLSLAPNTRLVLMTDAGPADAQALALPPEPVVPAVRLRLSRGEQTQDVFSQGFAPFAVRASADGDAS